MDFTKLKEDKGMYLYKTSNFVTNRGVLYFEIENDIKSIFTYRIIMYIINESNNIYKDLNGIAKEKKMLYGTDISVGLETIGAKLFLKVSFNYVDESVIGEKYQDEVYEFIHNYLYEASITKESVRYVKTRVLNILKKNISNKDYIIDAAFNNNILKGTVEDKFMIADLEKIEKIFDSITVDDVGEAYEELFTDERFYRGVLLGRYTQKEYEKIRDVLPFESEKKTMDYSGKEYDSSKDFEFENKDYKGSVLRVCFKTNEDSIFNRTLCMMLNNSNGLLHQILRDKYGLVYSAYSQNYIAYNLILIEADIDKNNKEKTLEAIDEVFDILHDEEKLNYYFAFIADQISDLIESCEENSEQAMREFRNYIMKNGNASNIYEYWNKVKDYDAKEFIKKLDRVEKTNEFFYKGGK